MKTIKAFHLLVACLLAAQLVAAELPEFKEASLPCHRLPTNVEPTKYELHLKFPSLDSDVYEGQVDIDVDFVRSNTKRLAELGLKDISCVKDFDKNTIVLHADKMLEIQGIEVVTRSMKAVDSTSSCIPFCKKKSEQVVEIEENMEIGELTRDAAKQMIAIKLKRGIHASRHGTPGRIKINFKGRMRTDKRGVYLSTYNDGKQVFKHIVTQFQPTFARTVFPSFDEPRLRAKFSVSVTYPKGLTAYGNTKAERVEQEGDQTLTRFATTPPMPVHMVAFAIGQFDEPLETISRSFRGQPKGRTIRVITAPGKRETGRFALEVAERSLVQFDSFIEYDFPLEKLDVIAIADLERDNTESWGLVFVRDTLLWIDAETEQEANIRTTLNIAHVVAHQWFGNLISANWWSDLWITEGVAAQFSIEMIQKMYYHEIPEFVRLTTLSGALQADQTGNLHPLSPSEENLQTSDQINAIFDNLEFMKSASMAQMIHNTIGENGLLSLNQYRESLIKLVRERAYKTVSFAHYQSAILSESSHDAGVLDFINQFPKYIGVPIVNCQFDTSDQAVKLDLESFAEASPDMAQSRGKKQPLPITVDMVLMAGYKSRQYKASDSIKINSVGTYYRIRYSDELYDRLEVGVKSGRLSDQEKIRILDDANSFLQARLISLKRFKSLLDSFRDEKSPAVILAILTATNTYRALSPKGASPPLSNKAIWYMFEAFGFVNFHDDLIGQHVLQVVLTALIKQGNKRVIAAALEEFVKNPTNQAVSLRKPLYTAVALHGSSQQVGALSERLWKTKSYDEQIRLLTALTLSKNKVVLGSVRSWLKSSGLKPETIKPFLDTCGDGWD